MKTEEDYYRGLGDPTLLEKIDKLFACNVGEYIDLPQLVVVGDQSSGKSSVLEGLMGLPFPRDSGLCTRFATQIIFTRSPEERIVVSIIPDIEATTEYADKVKAWSSSGLKTLDAGSFANIMGEVNNVMGLSDQQEKSDSTKPTFSKDVLRLEIFGPEEEHLSVIDVPGIFKNTSSGLTTKMDIDLVRSIVKGYMENPRSVMMTVIPANVDVATQEILQLAADVDPDGHRTLGVLTKPDIVDEGAEPRVVDLIAGRAHLMTLGWHLVRNPSQKQLSDPTVNRRVLEKEFFRTKAPWDKLEKSKVGMGSLRIRLQDILASHIRREFPKVRTEITKKLKAAQHHLKELGMERETPEKQRAYLLDIATRYQKVVAHALDAKYGSSDFFDSDESLRLATAVISRNTAFGDDMDIWGHQYRFNSPMKSPNGDASGQPASVLSTTPDAVEIRRTIDPPELEEILVRQKTLPGCREESITEWLEVVYQTSRGFELGTFDSAILGTTMKKQSSKWTSLASGYVSDVVAIVHSFIIKLLALICVDDRVTRELSATLIDDLLDRYQKALDQVEFILSVERNGTPITLDHYFNDNLGKCCQKRVHALMSQKSFIDRDSGVAVVRLDEAAQYHPMSNTEQIVQYIHDILCSYYEVARKRFVDNVCMYAIDHFLISGPETPLTLLSPSFLNKLDPDQLERIAGEEFSTKSRRDKLKREIESLSVGKGILK